SRLVGAPPGYVGYEEGGQLTEAVRRRPYAVILLDEIEKAHPEVFNILLQVLDDGRLTDGKGRTVDFRNSVIIMTSNLGSDIILEEASSEGRQRLIADVLRQSFRPEFLNRVDEVVIFSRLTDEELRRIVEIQLSDLEHRLGERRIRLHVSPAGYDWLASRGYQPEFGARPLRRVIQRNLEDPLAVKLLAGDVPDGSTIEVDAQGDGLTIRVESLEPVE
ncbi:MAG: AAA family ATPase, partial [Thermaerobacter sp.]|nr:AAA family ATPase [Thermaerobacter sp.]